MADDNSLRTYRTSDPKRHSNAPDGTLPSDPLAELARLIGQTDPFADVARGHPQGEEPRTAQPTPTLRDAPPTAGDWRQFVERPNYYEPEPATAPMPADHGRYRATGDQFTDDWHRQYATDDYPDDRTYRADDIYRPIDAEPAEATQSHAAGYQYEQAYDDPPGRTNSGSINNAINASNNASNASDNTANTSRSGRLAFAGMLVGCALVGTAGAYGYRAVSKPSTGAKSAPVIVADKSPSKIVPAATAEQKGRSQDRIATKEAGERLAPREEQPAPLPSAFRVAPPAASSAMAAAPSLAATGSTPASVPSAAVAAPPPAAAVARPPSPVAPIVWPPPPTAAAQPAAAPPSNSPNEPKRVRTVTIRPEGGDTSGRPQAVPSRARENTQTARPAPPPARGAPLSLDPGSQAAQASEPARTQRSLTPPAPREGAPSTSRVASAPATDNGANGGYLVQVSSQRSESDARASYRGLQAKYPQLKSRQPVVRRVDLGSKGTYYRAMIGPFSSTGEAEKFCSGLRAAGGQCIILRN